MDKVTELKPNEIDLSTDGLPDELLKQLTKPRDSDKRQRVIAIIGELIKQGKEANVNNILITYYRKYKEVLPRTSTISHISKIAADGDLVIVEGKRGVYKLPE